MNNPNI